MRGRRRCYSSSARSVISTPANGLASNTASRSSITSSRRQVVGPRRKTFSAGSSAPIVQTYSSSPGVVVHTQQVLAVLLRVARRPDLAQPGGGLRNGHRSSPRGQPSLASKSCDVRRADFFGIELKVDVYVGDKLPAAERGRLARLFEASAQPKRDVVVCWHRSRRCANHTTMNFHRPRIGKVSASRLADRSLGCWGAHSAKCATAALHRPLLECAELPLLPRHADRVRDLVRCELVSWHRVHTTSAARIACDCSPRRRPYASLCRGAFARTTPRRRVTRRASCAAQRAPLRGRALRP